MARTPSTAERPTQRTSARNTFDIASNRNADVDGAELAVNPPELPNLVNPSAFDPTRNYKQKPVLAPYNPQGIPTQSHGPNGVLCTVVNGLTVPTGDEDAIAYTARSAAPAPTFQQVSPWSFLNTGRPGGPDVIAGPVNPNSGGTDPIDPGDGQPNPYLHGIRDAVTSLVPQQGNSEPGTPNLPAIEQTAMLPQLSDQQPGRAPMNAPLMVPQKPMPAGKKRLTPAHLAIAVGAIGLLFIGMA